MLKLQPNKKFPGTEKQTFFESIVTLKFATPNKEASILLS